MRKIRIGRVGLYLLLTFALSWGSDWLLAQNPGYEAYLDLGMSPWGMFVPASVALILQLFVWPDSPIHFRTYRERPRWILLGFLALAVVYGLVTVLALLLPVAGWVLQGLGTLLITLWTLLVIFIAGRGDAPAFQRAGLQLGDVRQGQRFVLGAVGFLLLQTALNLAAGLGSYRGPAERVYGLPVPPWLYPAALAVLFVAVALIGGPLSGLAVTFGEEYGWRGFLQGELMALGRVQSALLVGLVWGGWHVPVIWRGVHTYPPTGLGLLLGLLFFALWGFVQSYAVLKTGGIWVAAFLHGVVNSVYSFLLTYVVRPDDMLRSFGLGVFGLVCLAAVVVAIGRDPLWRRQT